MLNERSKEHSSLLRSKTVETHEIRHKLKNREHEARTDKYNDKCKNCDACIETNIVLLEVSSAKSAKVRTISRAVAK